MYTYICDLILKVKCMRFASGFCKKYMTYGRKYRSQGTYIVFHNRFSIITWILYNQITLLKQFHNLLQSRAH